MNPRIRAAIDRLESIGLEPFAPSIINMELNGASFDEHIEWLLTAPPADIRSWWNAGWFDSSA